VGIFEDLRFDVKQLMPSAMKVQDLKILFHWRQHNAVDAIKNQEQCGSGWPFRRLATLKDNMRLTTRRFIHFLSKSWSIATIMIMDVVEDGCTMLIYGFRISGQVKVDVYPYIGQLENCRYNASVNITLAIAEVTD